MPGKILVLEKDMEYATKMCTLLINMHNFEVVHINTEPAAIRELTSSYFDLVVIGIREDRKKEALRLIDILLIEKKVVTAAPILVLSESQDPTFVQWCIKAGVDDYIIYPEDPAEFMPRLQGVIKKICWNR